MSDYHETTFTITFFYPNEPSPTSADGWQSGKVEKVGDGWEVTYENTIGGNWDSREKCIEQLEQKLEEVGAEEMLSGCICEDNFDYEYEGVELDIGA